MEDFLKPIDPEGPDDISVEKYVRVVTSFLHWKVIEEEANKAMVPMGRYVGRVLSHHAKAKIKAVIASQPSD